MMLATDRANTGRSLMLTNGCQVLSNQPQLHVTDRGEIDHRTGPTQVRLSKRDERKAEGGNRDETIQSE
jgi:hypothetical protein